MALPEVTTREEWLRARKDLLRREKELTRAQDALAADRRRLPMVEVTTDHRFTGPDGEVGLADLFAGRDQLVVQHVMFGPGWDAPCPSCSAALDELSDGLLEHLHARRTTFVAVSRAPWEELARAARERGWTFPWVSSFGGSFNHEFHATLDPAVAPVELNYRDADELRGAGMGWALENPGEVPGYSCFLTTGGRVFHTYSTFARGTEQLGGAYAFLDMTALGRQEAWQEPHDRVPDAREAVPNFAD
ncbi:DUF899 domain-containing protein [Kineococcus sp. SYSU DK002]|uniref:DUF899 domain-containing protein n=1 Tax=Kineococcus sp. SYSU DK002 TaxID=3383123 RepID=UPI003D7DC8F6